MQIKTNIPKDIRFDPISGTFQALVTLITDSGAYRYPCSCDGHIDMPLPLAALKLTQQAKARHAANDDLRSFQRAGGQTNLWSEQAPLPRAA